MFYGRGRNVSIPVKLVLPFCVLLFLSGCLGRLWPLPEKTDYRMAGIGQEPAGLRPYLQAIMDDRLAQEIEKSGDEAEDGRREAYREAAIDADLLKALRAKGYYDAAIE